MAASHAVPSMFRDPVLLLLVDEQDNELARLANPAFVPRVGENVRLRNVPYRVVRVGYDVPDSAVDRILIVCRPV